MATKPKGVDWSGLNELKRELLAWLEARSLAGPNEDELVVSLKLQSEPGERAPVVSAVAQALYEIEMFTAAGRRAARENILPRRAKLSEEERKLLALVTDDSVEREADRAIRALKPKLAHIERLVGRIAGLHVERAKAMRIEADRERIDRQHARVSALVERLQGDVRNLHRAFLFLSPTMRREELTLSGARRLEKRIRRSLAEAGFSQEKGRERSS